MRTKNTLLLAAVSAFALMMTTATANATYQCTWSDGIKVCGNELGFAPSAGGESDRRDQHSGDHDSGGGSGGASSDGGDGGEGSSGGEGGEDGEDGNGGGQGNNGGGNGGDDGSPNGKDDIDR